MIQPSFRPGDTGGVQGCGERVERMGCDLSDVWASSESSFAPFVIFVVRFTHCVANQTDDMPINNFLG